ncbi:MAG: SxtJ family membrane protein [Halarcobacter sp.]
MIKKNDLKIFVYIWAIIFLMIGVYPILKEEPLRYIFIIISISMFIISLVNINLYIKPYNIWMKFGKIMNKISTFIIMFILFYFLFTPISLILKVFSKDLLNKKIDSTVSSYWIKREEQPQSMKKQF